MLDAKEWLFDGSLAFGAGSERARAAWRILHAAWEQNQQEARVLLELARIELALGDTQGLSTRVPLLLQLLPEDPEVQSLCGLLALAHGKPQDALPWLERAAVGDEVRPERHLVLGTAEMLLGDLASAERSFRRSIQLDAASAEAHGNLGTVLVLLGRVPEGRAHLERATVISPRRATFVSNLAYAEFVEGHLDRAKYLARRALSIDEKLVSAWVNLALVEAKQGHLEEARSALLRAKSLDPEDPRVLANLADLEGMSR